MSELYVKRNELVVPPLNQHRLARNAGAVFEFLEDTLLFNIPPNLRSMRSELIARRIVSCGDELNEQQEEDLFLRLFVTSTVGDPLFVISGLYENISGMEIQEQAASLCDPVYTGRATLTIGDIDPSEMTVAVVETETVRGEKIVSTGRRTADEAMGFTIGKYTMTNSLATV